VRLDEFVLRLPGDEFTIRFHPQLTVLAGVGEEERRALAEQLVGALTGEADGAELSVAAASGRGVRLTTRGGRVSARHLDDDSPAPAPIGWFAPNAGALRQLVLIRDESLDPGRRSRGAAATPELAEALALLDHLAAAVADAVAARDRRIAARERLTVVDDRLRRATGAVARQAHRRTAADLADALLEADVLAAGPGAVDADEALLTAVTEARAAADGWAEAVETFEDVAVAVGAFDVLAARTTARDRDLEGDCGATPALDQLVASTPDTVPDDLTEVVAAVAAAEGEVHRLEAHHRALAADRLGPVSDPVVSRLAAVDQAVLWPRLARVAAADAAYDRERTALGGLAPAMDGDRRADDLEVAHSRQEAAAALLARRRGSVTTLVGLVAAVGVVVAVTAGVAIGAALVLIALVGGATAIVRPLLDHRRAALEEAAACARVGAPSHLAFHLRRMEAGLAPGTLARYRLVEAERADSRAEWWAIAPGVDPVTAAGLEPEVRAHAAALAGELTEDGEVAAVRQALDDEALPARDEAWAALDTVLVPYGVTLAGLAAEGVAATDGATIARTVVDRVGEGIRARARTRLHEAVAEESNRVQELASALRAVGLTDGALAERVAALDEVVAAVVARQRGRGRGRPAAVVADDVARLQAELRRTAAAVAAAVSGAVAADPAIDDDLDALTAERDTLAALLAGDGGDDDDLERLHDRHAAMARRVAAAEERAAPRDHGATELSAISRALLAHLSRNAAAGPLDEPLPVVLDEPFTGVPAERMWELLDELRGAVDRTQVVLLTDDPFVGAWARRQADAGALTLLEPADA
jgi:hypothetical protein